MVLIASVVAALTCLLAGMVATPVTICLVRDVGATTSGEESCTCAHGADAACPMHKLEPTTSGPTRWGM